MELQDVCQNSGVHLTLAAPEHQEINRKFKLIRRTLCTIANSLMVHATSSEAYIHFELMYMTYRIVQ